MIHLTEAFTRMGWEGDLARHIEEGNVTARFHPDLPLTIYNYTPQCAYDRTWDDVTLNCRGLILDHEGYVVARPYEKFFNYGERESIINLSTEVEVTDKLDGSLGILYNADGGWAIATRGSFVSDQALAASEVWDEKYANISPPEEYTFLFEILLPWNRIVVNYFHGTNEYLSGSGRALSSGIASNDQEGDLVLLGAVHKHTGDYLGPNDARIALDWSGPVAQVFPYGTLADALAVEPRPNAEGFVVRAGTEMLKIKQDDYIAMHRIVTGLSNRIVWEHLGAGTIDELRDTVPDELYEWFDQQVELLQREFDMLYGIAERELADAQSRLGNQADRKSLAFFLNRDAMYPGLCFALLDGKDIGPMIWKMIRPTRETPVITTQEDE